MPFQTLQTIKTLKENCVSELKIVMTNLYLFYFIMDHTLLQVIPLDR